MYIIYMYESYKGSCSRCTTEHQFRDKITVKQLNMKLFLTLYSFVKSHLAYWHFLNIFQEHSATRMTSNRQT